MKRTRSNKCNASASQPNNRMQHDAAGAACNLGVTLKAVSVPRRVSLQNPPAARLKARRQAAGSRRATPVRYVSQTVVQRSKVKRFFSPKISSQRCNLFQFLRRTHGHTLGVPMEKVSACRC